jgi:hypothetical protein
MSTGLNCEIREVSPERWYYVLEDGNAPKDSWDWHEYATAYGPFGSYDAACEHLRRNHANPGGHLVVPYNDPLRNDTDVLRQLIASAKNPAVPCAEDKP